MSTEQSPEEKPVLMSEEEQERVKRYLASGGDGFTEERIEQAIRVIRTMHKHAGIIALEDARFLILIDNACKQLTEEKKDG